MVATAPSAAATPDAPNVDGRALLRGLLWALPPSLAAWAAVLWGLWQLLA